MTRLPILLSLLLSLALLGCGEEEKDLTTYAPQVQAYCDKLMAYAKEADNAVADFADKSGRLGEGITIYEAYDAANTAMKTCDAANYAISRENVPDLPDQLEDMLENVRSELSTAYYVKSNALESAMKFLDTQSPAALQEYRDNMEQSSGFIIRGVAKLTQAKVTTGIIKTEQ